MGKLVLEGSSELPPIRGVVLDGNGNWLRCNFYVRGRSRPVWTEL